jgi:hypothetical protein
MNSHLNGTNGTNGTNGANGASDSKTHQGPQYENYFRGKKPPQNECLPGPQRVLSKLSDEDLMVLVVDGCHHAFNEIFRRYNRMVMYIASRSLDYTEAEDIMQEIFFHTILESGWRFNPEKSKFKSWLWSCTLHRVWRRLSYFEVRRRHHETAINLYRARGGHFDDFDEN